MQSIIVVEGTHDEALIKAVFPNQPCIITNGSEISLQTLNMIKELSLHNKIIIFTDPDFPGERIRSKIHEIVPNAVDCFLKKKDCISKNHKKVGVEHASLYDIKELLTPLLNNDIKPMSNITRFDLYSLNLIGVDSSNLRKLVSDRLNIGNPNGKTFLNRINWLGITKEELEKIVGEINGKNR